MVLPVLTNGSTLPLPSKGLMMTRPLKLAIAGIGNCASALVQGIHFYGHDIPEGGHGHGLMSWDIGGVVPGDIEVVAAFDVTADKVGRRLGAAIHAVPNQTLNFAPVPEDYGPKVLRGPLDDGIGIYLDDVVSISHYEPVDVAQTLRDTDADVLVAYLPVGSERDQKAYAQAALDAGVAFVNAIPVFIASDPVWAQKFHDAGVPIIGDDIKSQVGATILHRSVARLFEARGLTIDEMYQLNVGGNTDFLNMLERGRLESKKISKTQAVTGNLQYDFNPRNVHVGPSDHVPHLGDRKHAIMQIVASGFGGATTRLNMQLEVWDSPNSAGVIIDAVRVAHFARQHGVGGPLDAASAFFMKSPPHQLEDFLALDELRDFLTYTPQRSNPHIPQEESNV